jgi:hypothetical protein
MAEETRLEGPALTAILSGHSLYAGNAGEIEQMFHPDGVTFYLDHGNASQGTWKVENGQYCSSWPPNPALICYSVMKENDTVTFVSNSGKRFPMRLSK